jgi:hypothetical protein
VTGSDGDDSQKVVKAAEVVDVARVERQIGGQGSGGDQEIDSSGPAGFAASGNDRGVDASVGSRRGRIERNRIEAGFSSLLDDLDAAHVQPRRT